MRFLTQLAFSILLLTAPELRAFEYQAPAPQFPANANGRYVGKITVTETVPMPPATGSLPAPAASTVLRTRAVGRVQAAIHNGKIRLLAAPGSSLLGYLDEPSYASVSVNPVIANPSGVFIGFVAHARNGTGAIQRTGNRVRLRFELTAPHAEFALADQAVTGTLDVVIDLSRTGN